MISILAASLLLTADAATSSEYVRGCRYLPEKKNTISCRDATLDQVLEIVNAHSEKQLRVLGTSCRKGNSWGGDWNSGDVLAIVKVFEVNGFEIVGRSPREVVLACPPAPTPNRKKT